MLNPKQLRIFVLILFTFVASMFALKFLKKNDFHDTLLKAEIMDFQNIRFYKDYMRDDAGLNLPLKDSADIISFVSALKTVESSSQAIKSLAYNKRIKLQFGLGKKEPKIITVTIYRSPKTGETGTITIDQGETFVQSIGTFSSEKLLEWAENMEKKPGYDKISSKF